MLTLPRSLQQLQLQARPSRHDASVPTRRSLYAFRGLSNSTILKVPVKCFSNFCLKFASECVMRIGAFVKMRIIYTILSCLPAVFSRSAVGQRCWKNLPCTGPDHTAWPGPWESNIYAPSSRKVSPKSIISPENGSILSSFLAPITLIGNGSTYVLDFGVEVGGLVTVDYSANGTGSFGLAFTEAKDFIGEWSDTSNGGFKGPDGAIYANFTAGDGTYTMPDISLRGGFRYLTIFLMTKASTAVQIDDISLEIGFQPTWGNLRAYQGYFHSDDELLNRIWYSGAYTLQTNTVPVNTGRQIPAVASGWANNATLGPGDTILVDGAKRDRAVWPGDMGIAVPSVFVSIGQLDSVRNALQVMYDNQVSHCSWSFDKPSPGA